MTFETEQTSLNLQYITFLSVNKVNVDDEQQTTDKRRSQNPEFKRIYETRDTYFILLEVTGHCQVCGEMLG